MKIRAIIAVIALTIITTVSVNTQSVFAACGGLNPACPSTPTMSGSAGINTATLTWTQATNDAIVYILKRGTVIVYSGGNSTYTDTGLTSGTTYTYTIQACNNSGCGTADSSTNVTPTAGSAPSAPTLDCTSVFDRATCTWTSPSNTTSYVLKDNGQQIMSGTNTKFVEQSLRSGTSYAYTVQACNTYGCSSDSNTETEVPPAATPTELVTYAAFRETVHHYAVSGAALVIAFGIATWFILQFKARIYV